MKMQLGSLLSCRTGTFGLVHEVVQKSETGFISWLYHTQSLVTALK